MPDFSQMGPFGAMLGNMMGGAAAGQQGKIEDSMPVVDFIVRVRDDIRSLSIDRTFNFLP